jgi:hypothetical protein
VFSSDRVRSSDLPSCIPVSSRRQGGSTQGNSSQIVTQAQTVPAFERGDYGKRCCTRFRTTISMQYPWVEKDPSGVSRRGQGYRRDVGGAEGVADAAAQVGQLCLDHLGGSDSHWRSVSALR